MAANRPFIVILPGGSQNPTHYGYLAHLLQLAGYPTYSALLPSVGASEPVTIQDDMAYIRDRMILPILEHEGHDVVLVMHSYSGIPGSAAALNLGKKERLAQGKKTSVIGQIFVAAMLQKGGDGTDIFTTIGGAFPPFLRPDVGARRERDIHSHSGTNSHGSPTPISSDAMIVYRRCIQRRPQFSRRRLLHRPWRRG
jgi:hypothetical protein